MQVDVQTPLLQVDALVFASSHVFEQVPQWLGSLCRSMQPLPPQVSQPASSAFMESGFMEIGPSPPSARPIEEPLSDSALVMLEGAEDEQAASHRTAPTMPQATRGEVCAANRRRTNHPVALNAWFTHLCRQDDAVS